MMNALAGNPLRKHLNASLSAPTLRQWATAGKAQFDEREAEEMRFRMRQILLALGMLFAGTVNTITCKYTFQRISLGHNFTHPFVMTTFMFAGEALCIVWYYLSTNALWRPDSRAARDAARVPKLNFALPAMCDILATSMMYVGLALTTASTYQMLRGTVIVFTGAISAVFLRRRQWGFHWVGMCLVFSGVCTVGVAAATGAASPVAKDPWLGSVLTAFAQLFTASQMCLEEKFCHGYGTPALLAVGWEGMWGLLGMGVVLVLLQLSEVDGAPAEDSILAARQMADAPYTHRT